MTSLLIQTLSSLLILCFLVSPIEITDITEGDNHDSLIMDEFWDRSSINGIYEAEKSFVRLTGQKYDEQIVGETG